MKRIALMSVVACLIVCAGHVATKVDQHAVDVGPGPAKSAIIIGPEPSATYKFVFDTGPGPYVEANNA